MCRTIIDDDDDTWNYWNTDWPTIDMKQNKKKNRSLIQHEHACMHEQKKNIHRYYRMWLHS